MSEVLNVTRREQVGTAHNRRLRRTGQVPATLYGHGEQSVSLAVAGTAVLAAVRHGGKLVSLQGDVSESALIREVQWDTYGKELIHVDFMRVSETESVETTVAIELKGSAPGLTEGGIIQFILHELEIECPAAKIPEKIIVSVNDLHLGKAIHAGEVQLPEGAKVITDASLVVVQCVAPHAEAEEGAEGAVAEPELIRKEKGDDEADDKKK
jgi:large subunit ribosomal protein L25